MGYCDWDTSSELNIRYHDEEWGVPLHDDRGQFEYLMMEVMQCGLSWDLMIKKREIFRPCFDNFEYDRIAEYDENDIERIMNTEGMIRSRRKIEAVINNARCFQKMREEFGSFDDFYPGYHMNKRNWITIVLDGTISFDEICRQIDASFEITASAKQKKKFRQPKEWIIPANPKYYDIVHAFDDEEIINWKQGAGIIKGDTVFMYVGAPVSAVLYKCKVIETDIPYDYSDKNLTIKALMKIQLQKRYKPDKFTFEVLKDEYGIAAIRGPRGITNSLSAALK